MSLPTPFGRLLHDEKFCFLATCHQDRPHLSLMNFTYVAEDLLVILTSRRATTKVRFLERNPAVALLVSDIMQGKPSSSSCTFYGVAQVLDSQQEGDFRKKHIRRHPDMSTFIEGAHIAVITVRLQYAALVDETDSVRTWEAQP